MKNSQLRVGKQNEHKVFITTPWDDAVEGINFCLERIYELDVFADDELVPGIKNEELTSALIQARNTIRLLTWYALTVPSIGELETTGGMSAIVSKLKRSLGEL